MKRITFSRKYKKGKKKRKTLKKRSRKTRRYNKRNRLFYGGGDLEDKIAYVRELSRSNREENTIARTILNSYIGNGLHAVTIPGVSLIGYTQKTEKDNKKLADFVLDENGNPFYYEDAYSTIKPLSNKQSGSPGSSQVNTPDTSPRSSFTSQAEEEEKEDEDERGEGEEQPIAAAAPVAAPPPPPPPPRPASVVAPSPASVVAPSPASVVAPSPAPSPAPRPAPRPAPVVKTTPAPELILFGRRKYQGFFIYKDTYYNLTSIKGYNYNDNTFTFKLNDTIMVVDRLGLVNGEIIPCFYHPNNKFTGSTPPSPPPARTLFCYFAYETDINEGLYKDGSCGVSKGFEKKYSNREWQNIITVKILKIMAGQDLNV
jgi:hypothetical protein